MPTQILVVEDEPAIAQLLSYALGGAGYAVTLATDAPAARQAVAAQLPDLAIVDWMMPGESGVALARAWRADARTRALPIIMLTAKGAEEDKVMGLDAGADDYVTKPFSPKELVSRINAVLRRRAPEASAEVLACGPIHVDAVRHEATAHGAPLVLGPTEFKLLRFLVAHPERVFSRTQLLDQVWGDHVFLEDRTVDVHILRLRKALTAANADGHVQTVRGSGYRMSARAEG
jgi:two-component system, OmpR family, phosphate regulon response regulator PhoB